MKNLKIIIALPVALLLLSCAKVNETSQVADSAYDTIRSITYTVPNLIDDDFTTKVLIDDNNCLMWAEGDTVGIYPNQGSQVYFTIESGGSASAEFDGGGWAFRYGSTYSAYYPFIGDIYLDKTKIPVVFTGQKQKTTTGTSHIGPFLYMYSDPTSVSSGSLNFGFKHLCVLLRFTVTLPAGTYTKLALTAPTKAFVSKGHYNLSAGNGSIVGDEYSTQIQMDLENVTLSAETQFKVYAVTAPVNLNGVELTVSVLDSQKKERQCKKTPSKAYNEPGHIYGLSCTTWTEVSQNMGMIIEDWGSGGNLSGDAE